MKFLEYYKDAVGKTVKDVKEYCDTSFDDEAEFTLMTFRDDTALLIMHQPYFTTRSGIIMPDSNLLDKAARLALGL